MPKYGWRRRNACEPILDKGHPGGDTKICFLESDMDVRRATLAADGGTDWNEISRPEAVSIWEIMQARREAPLH